MQIRILCVGKLKEKSLKALCEEYQKRLGAFVKLQIIELPEGKMPQDPSAAQIENCLAQEGQSILSKIPAQSFVVAMCIEAQMRSSEQLAETFLRQQTGGISQMSFIIGGSWGLDPAVKQRSHLKLSMSRMTFPHQLARVMLLEQIYRACSINNHSKYHK